MHRGLLIHGSPVGLNAAALGRAVVSPLILATVLLACSSASVDDRCAAAFRDVDPRALPPYGASPLDDAIRACGSAADFRAAWDAVPAAHEGTTDAYGFLADRCGDASLAPTAICRELAAAP